MEGELQKSNKLFIIEPNSTRFLSREDLLQKGYPRENDNEEAAKKKVHYLIMSLKSINSDNLLYAKAFDVSKLEGCGKGRLSSNPFVTTVEDLLNNIVK